MPKFLAPVSLNEALHSSLLENFDCGDETINDWLKKKALANEFNGGSRTYVVLTSEGDLAGFFCLASHSVSHRDLKAAFKRNMPNPVPTILLGRMGVAVKYQRSGLGKSMSSQCVRIARSAKAQIGTKALIVHPISAAAAKFYCRHGFQEAKARLPMLYYPL